MLAALIVPQASFAAIDVSPPDISACATSTANPIAPGSTPAFPGTWWNPDRDGTSWALRFIDNNRLSVVWFTFDRERRPTWLLSDEATIDLATNTFSAPLRRYTWNWTTNTINAGEHVGAVALAFSDADPSRAAIRWQWDEVSTASSDIQTECIRDFSRLGPSLQNANSTFSGEWFEEGFPGWGLSLNIIPQTQQDGGASTYVESGTLGLYDDNGDPVWLFIAPESTVTAPPTGVLKSFDLEYVTPSGRYPAGVPINQCNSQDGLGQCSNHASGAGTYSRLFTTPLAMLARVSATAGQSIVGDAGVTIERFDRPPSGGAPGVMIELSKLTAADLVLVDRADCTIPTGQSSCAITVDWSANPAHSDPTVFRIDLATSQAQQIGSGTHGEFVDQLTAGMRVQYELHDSATRDASPLYRSIEVQALGSALPTPSRIGVDRTVCAVNDGTLCTVGVDWAADTTLYPGASVFRVDLETGNRVLLQTATSGVHFDGVLAGSRVQYELRASNLSGSSLLVASPEVRVRVISRLTADPTSCDVPTGGTCSVQSNWAVDPIDYPNASLFLRNIPAQTSTFLLTARRGLRFENLGAGNFRYEVRATVDASSTLVIASADVIIREPQLVPPDVDAPDAAVCTLATLPILQPGSTPTFPGTWWNPERDGTGWSLIYDDNRDLRLYWFTFDSQRRPVWLLSDKASVDSATNTYRARLRQYRWSGSASDAGTHVGSVALTFLASDPTRAAVRWQWNEAGTEPPPPECIRDFARSSPTPQIQNVNAAFSGEWHEPALPGYQVVVSVMPLAAGHSSAANYVETGTAAVFDSTGYATWLLIDPLFHSSAPAIGTSASTGLLHLTPTVEGYPTGVPLQSCDSTRVCYTSAPSGDYTRSFQSTETMSARIVPTRAGLTTFRRPSSGDGAVTLVKRSAKNLVLVDRLDCTVSVETGTCPIRVDWSAAVAHSAATLFRRDLRLDDVRLIGTGVSGQVTDLLQGGDRVQYELRANSSLTSALLFKTAEVRGLSSVPLVRIASPLDGARYTDPASYNITAVATDPNRPVSRVEFLINGNLGCDATFAPYTCYLAQIGPGTYRIQAKGYDTQNVATLSAPVTIVVEQAIVPPSVTLSSPTPGTEAEAPARFTITARVQARTSIDRVVFYANGTPIHTTSTSSGISPSTEVVVGVYTYEWEGVGEGTYELTARAYDSAGLEGVSANNPPVTVTVLPAPTVELPTADVVSDAVGATAGEFRVDESGAATYSVPLYAAPGTAGVVPQLGLNYSSQGSVGPVGKGWSISGTSSIARCRGSREAGDSIISGVPVDSDAPPIEFSINDKLCLDGQRLIEVQNGGSTYPSCPTHSGASVKQFRTEIESFQRVCAYGFVEANGPRYFTIERKDGSTSWYGDRRSAIAGDAGDEPNGYVTGNVTGQETTIFQWAQTRFQDSTGNYLDYSYVKDPAGSGKPGEHLLRDVAYTGKLVLPGQTGRALLPYASLVFTYEPLPLERQSLGYVAGSQFWRTRQLASIQSLNNGDVLRHYAIKYRSADSGSGEPLLETITECRNATMAVCLAPTTFTWSAAKNELTTGTTVRRLDNGSLAKFEGLKFGDVDGDGRQDLVWVKDALNSDRDCQTDQVHVAFGRLNAQQVPEFVPAGSPTCVPDELLGLSGEAPDSSWYLLDYNGDGKDDLFFRTASGWKGVASVGEPRGSGGAFNAPSVPANDLLIDVNPVIPGGTHPDHQPQQADLNGDGLIDLVYFRNNTIVARTMERVDRNGTQGFRWSGERTVTPASGFNPCDGVGNNCRWATTGLYRKRNYQQLNDFNGDARSDLLAVVDVTRDGACPTAPPGDNGPPTTPRSVTTPSPSAPMCTIPWVYALTVDRAAQGHITVKAYPRGRWSNAYFDGVSFVDINGDGLTDIVNHNETFSIPVFQLNHGDGYETVVGSVLSGAGPTTIESRQLQMMDVNGDGRADAVYPHASFNRFVMRRGLASSGFGSEEEISGGGAQTNCDRRDCLPKRSFMFGDYDSDGGLDFVRFEWGTSANAEVIVSRAGAASLRRPRDVITRVTNGLGATTDLTYLPLTNKAVYRSEAGARNALQIGRGAPVRDFVAPMYVVAKASSSAPTFGAPNAKSSVRYRYVGAKLQAGGRGFLGFSQVHSIEDNHGQQYVLSVTDYRQDFPFIGRPLATVKTVFNGQYNEDTCVTTIKDACFVTSGTAFEAFNGRAVTIAESYSHWESPNFTPGAQSPVRVRLRSSTDVTYDLGSGDVLSRVDNTFGYDGWDNTSATQTRTYATTFADGNAPDPVASVVTDNSYTNDGTKWRLGRLTTSTVTHQRPGQIDVVRRTDYAYDLSGPTTGLLTMERVQQGAGLDQDLRTFHVLDAFGNRLRTHTCSSDLSEAQCKSTAIAFQPAGASTIQRYSRQAYDPDRGRFVESSHAPFWNGSGTSEITTQMVRDRNEFGDVIHVEDIHGTKSIAVFGSLGRPYYQWKQTVAVAVAGHPADGVEMRTTYRWCGSDAGKVECPVGASYREQVTATGSPVTWSYYDVLARQMLSVGQGFNAGVVGKEFAASCGFHDARGRASRKSEPFFLSRPALNGEPAFGGSDPCSSVYWTVTKYDVLDRTTLITGPDFSSNQFAYDGLVTTTTDALVHSRNEKKNALGELVRATDAAGMSLDYVYNAAGNLASVTRDGGRGAIVNDMGYDALGRKTSSTDPDAGTWSYDYNALGEMITQTALAGARTEQRFDARGRVYLKWVESAAGQRESTQTFVHDTATNGRGQVASESIAGTYAEWVGQSTLAHSYGKTASYDSLGRPHSSTTTIGGVAHTMSIRYDDLGRPWQQLDASGRWLKTDFDERGYARALCESNTDDTDADCDTGTAYQQTLETDARGNVVRERRGGTTAMDVVRTYDAQTGRLDRICAGGSCSIQSEDYDWDVAGNLKVRDKVGQYREVFNYDPLNRLTDARYERVLSTVYAPGTGPQSVAMKYDRLGNICSKLIDGAAQAYGYGGAGGCGLGDLPGSGAANPGVSPHAVRAVGEASYGYDAYGNQTSADLTGTARDRFIRYSAEQQAYEIALGSAANPLQRSRFWYGPGGQRYLREDSAPGTSVKRTLYLGNVEVVQQGGATTLKRYVAGVLVQEIVGLAGTSKYLFTDHLGSVVRATNATGIVLEGMDYGAFGERRGFVDPQIVPVAAPIATNRGFTGHEMLDGLDIVHMNGRLYDSRIARFLQADPFVQEPNNAQNFNRYTYLWNNPLNATDPSGYLGLKERQWLGAIIVVVAVITQQYWAAVKFGTAAGFAWTVGAGAVAGGVSSGTWNGALWGAFSAAVFYGVGDALGTAAGPLQRGLAMGTAGGVLSTMQGGKFGHAFASAGLGAAIGPRIGSISNDTGRVIIGALAGGSVSALTGGKFANGAVTAAFSYAFARGANAGCSADASDCPKPGGQATGAAWDLASANEEWLASGKVRMVDGVLRINLNVSGPNAEAISSGVMSYWNGASGEYEGSSYRVEARLTPVAKGGDWQIRNFSARELASLGRLTCGLAPGGYNDFGSSVLKISRAWNQPGLPAHEFGHALGLRHAPMGYGSIMSYDAQRAVLGRDLYNLSRGYR